MFFDFGFGGHVMEWMNHLYHEAAMHQKNFFVFVFREDEFKALSPVMRWNEYENVSIILMPADDVRLANTGGTVRKIFSRNRILLKYLSIIKPDRVFLSGLEQFLPLLSILFIRKIQFYGVIYDMYLHRKGSISFLSRLKYGINYWLYANVGRFDCIFLLNDKSSTEILNKKYRSVKFKYLCDPIPNQLIIKNIESDIKNKICYLHFGGLCERKGTLTILRALCLLSSKELSDKRFIFAGSVYPEIKQQFYEYVGILSKMTEVDVYDDFCSYEKLSECCERADFILAPYENTSFSSGCVGFGAFFNKPVVVPGHGLLGSLVQENGLGICLEDNSVGSLLTFFRGQYNLEIGGHLDYIESHSVSNFLRTIFRALLSAESTASTCGPADIPRPPIRQEHRDIS